MRDGLGVVLCHHGRPFNCSECGDDYGREIAQPLGSAAQTWRSAALCLGEELARVGPHGYYGFTPEQWLAWARANVRPVRDTSGRLIAPPQSTAPDRPSGPHDTNRDAREPVKE